MWLADFGHDDLNISLRMVYTVYTRKIHELIISNAKKNPGLQCHPLACGEGSAAEPGMVKMTEIRPRYLTFR